MPIKIVHDIIARCINANIQRVETMNGELRITCEGRHANIVDARSLMTCLNELKDIGYISDKTMTMWVGIRDGKLTIFARM